jgi:hypothetical protein
VIVDNTHHLREAERQRHARLLGQAREALRRLDNAGKPVTVAAVVRESGVSRAFLYRQAGLVAEIQSLRDRQTATGQHIPAHQRAGHASQHARIRQLVTANTELRAENARLREQNAQLLGRLREQAATHPRPSDDGR